MLAPKTVSYGASVKGEDHKENEDTILVEDGLGLYAVADGVTMPYGGGPASRLAISSLRSLFKGDLAETIPSINKTVLEEKKKSPGIGSSTLTAAQVIHGSVRIAHAGDSFAFLIRENSMILKTTPQNREGFLTNTIGEYFEGAALYNKEIKSGDYLILATDGVTAVLNHNEIMDIVTRQKEPKRIVEYSLGEIGRRSRQYRDDRSMVVVRT
ncbi:MAG TPA: SpoIIE family protein phosphatase [Candidatus Bathyarchaeia archaeon]